MGHPGATVTPGRFLLVSHDAGGTVPPMLAIAEALVGRGHRVTMLGQPSIERRATDAGCAFLPFRSLPDYERNRPLEEQLELVLAVMTGSDPGDDLLAAVDDERADVAVLDCNLAGAAAAAESRGLPSMILLHSMYKTYVDVWFGELWPFFAPAVNATRSRYGLDPCASWTEIFERHHRLGAAVPELFDAPVASVPPNMRHAGFLVPKTPGSVTDVGFALDDRRAVLVGLSTTDLHQDRLLQTILDALAGVDARGLVTTAGQVDTRRLDVPANVVVRDYVPHHLALPHVDAVVTHAGLGTIAAALHHGLPILCTPISRDQPLNSARVVELGAGVSIAAADATSEEVRAGLVAVLGDPQYRDAATRIARASAAAGGAAGVALDLERMLAAS
jgi:UDP:flavonoid glycosyltransferase YjiC (YdhE family)